VIRANTQGQKPQPYLFNAMNDYKSNGGLDGALKDYSGDIGKDFIKSVKAAFKAFKI
jgi:hypothetical protein